MWSAIKRIGRNVVFGSTMYREVRVNITPFAENKQKQQWRYTQITAWQFALLETFIPRKERGDMFTSILLSKAETVIVWPYMTGEKSDWGMLNFIKPVVVPVRSLFRVLDLVLQFPNAALQKSFCKNERILLDEKVSIGRRILSGLGCTALFIPMTPVRILAGISHAILAPIDTIKGIIQIFVPENSAEKRQKLKVNTLFNDDRFSVMSNQEASQYELSRDSRSSTIGDSDSFSIRKEDTGGIIVSLHGDLHQDPVDINCLEGQAPKNSQNTKISTSTEEEAKTTWGRNVIAHSSDDKPHTLRPLG